MREPKALMVVLEESDADEDDKEPVLLDVVERIVRVDDEVDAVLLRALDEESIVEEEDAVVVVVIEIAVDEMLALLS